MDDGTGRTAGTVADRSEVIRYVADAVVPCDGTVPVLRPGAVEVAGDSVVLVGTPADLRSGSPAGVREVRVEGVLLPGMVNPHCPSPMPLFRGPGETLP